MRLVYVFILLISIIGLLFAQSSKLDKIIADGKMRDCVWPEYYGIS